MAFKLVLLPLLMALALSGAANLAQAQPPRIITLAPHLAELVFAAGASETLIGTVAWSDYPAAAATLPRIGDAFRLDLERIMLLNPDLALAWTGGTPAASVRRLESLEIEVVWISTRTLDDIELALIQLGERLGSEESGKRAAADFRDALDARPPFPPEIRQPAFYQVSDRPMITLGGRHILGQVLHRCGAYNVFSDLDSEASAVDFEAVLARRPAFIIAGTEPDDTDVLERWRQHRDLLPDEVRFIEIEPDTLIRPTPRIIDGIDRLCRLID